MEKIITALDYAKRDGFKTVKDHLHHIMSKTGKRYDTPLNGELKGKPVYAEINFGRWIAVCPDCQGAEDVDPNEPIFYCFSCGNFKNSGHPRMVVFPGEKEREAIEAEILKRPVQIKGGSNEVDRLVNAIPTVKTDQGVLSRSWKPGETVEEIRKQNAPIKAGK